jgi:CRP-like cAMP-binding protein
MVCRILVISMFANKLSPPRNKLLANTPNNELSDIAPLLKLVWLDQDHELFSPNAPIGYTYFPESGVVSVVACAGDHRRCHGGIYGSEGFGSLATVLGIRTSSNSEIVQVSGYAHRIASDDLRSLLSSTPNFHRLLLRYIHSFTLQIAHTALSTASTRIEQRLARWLLMLQDRIGGRMLAITHQRLAEILGVRRSGITEAVHMLEGRGLLSAKRGVIDILDRPGLIVLSAGCYGPAEAEFDRLP